MKHRADSQDARSLAAIFNYYVIGGMVTQWQHIKDERRLITFRFLRQKYLEWRKEGYFLISRITIVQRILTRDSRVIFHIYNGNNYFL